MAKLKVLHKMENVEKRIHRSAECEVIRASFPKGDNGFLVTLGGCYIDKKGKLIKGSEMDFFLNWLNWPANRIVSVDCDREVVERNNTGKLGVQNVWLPLKAVRTADCPIKVGEVGGIERMVVDMVNAGQKVSVVNADLMGTVRIMAPTVIGIMQALNKQKDKALLSLNFSINDRNNGGKYDATDALWKGTATRNGQRFFQAARKLWRELPLTINGAKHFGYTGNSTPMQAAFYLKGVGKKECTTPQDFATLTEKRVDMAKKRMAKAKKSTTFKARKEGPKDPKWVAAGLKAHATRLANLKKAAK